MAGRPRAPKQKPITRRRFSPAKFSAILDARLKRGLTYLDIQYATKVQALTTIYNWRKGKSQPDVDRFFALVEVLDVKDDELLEDY